MGFSSVLLTTHDTTHRMIKSLVLTCLVAAVRADADADAYYSIYGYAGVPFGSSTGPDPITQGLDPVTQGYAGYGHPYYGHYLGKRSADADPAVVVAGAVPFGSSTCLDPITQGLDPVTQGVALPYHGYAAYGYGYPYFGHHLIGKRSADADADAYYAGYPFAYAAHPYAYAGYHGYPYAGYAAYVPFGSSTGLDPITQGLDPVTQGLVY